jgi:hypothetical protein
MRGVLIGCGLFARNDLNAWRAAREASTDGHGNLKTFALMQAAQEAARTAGAAGPGAAMRAGDAQ